MGGGPPLWLLIAFSGVYVALLVVGAGRFQQLTQFFRNHHKMKNLLYILAYSYVPLCIVSMTFMWIGFDQHWDSGYVFVFLPLLPLSLLMLVLLVDSLSSPSAVYSTASVDHRSIDVPLIGFQGGHHGGGDDTGTAVVRRDSDEGNDRRQTDSIVDDSML